MKKQLYILFTILFFTAFKDEILAQSDYIFSQNIFNEFLYNPAAAGNSFTTSAFVQSRNQWIGISGAPTVQAASFDTYVESINSGLGASFAIDKISFRSTASGRLAYSYNIPILSESALALGLSAGFINRSIDASRAITGDPSDSELANANRSETSIDFEFGMEYKGPFKLGLSVRHLGPKESFNYFPKQKLNYWAYLSSRFNLSTTLSIEPITSFIYNEQGARLEGGALFYFMKGEKNRKYNDRFWLGALYRQSGEFSVLAGLHLTPKIRLGYAFDYGLGPIATLSKHGSHEVFIAFQFNRIFYKESLCPAYRNSGHRR